MSVQTPKRAHWEIRTLEVQMHPFASSVYGVTTETQTARRKSQTAGTTPCNRSNLKSRVAGDTVTLLRTSPRVPREWRKCVGMGTVKFELGEALLSRTVSPHDATRSVFQDRKEPEHAEEPCGVNNSSIEDESAGGWTEEVRSYQFHSHMKDHQMLRS
ncbi:hypothetical protein PoB_005711400 [Plakobranchus ocellatus]|uniref:Uncharacterized protein n=1 Tax=Plakobranchus ocellatus TaxID=259542 RepID=A0AAV4CHD2_9GAST|nr:hypothetical protein PoB_005711400 [Plakobranchus ocellatus]